jgi:hypothetical protein
MDTLVFRFFKFDFVPYSEKSGQLSSKAIFLDCIRELEQIQKDGNALSIDKNRNRIQDGPRQLYVNRLSRKADKSRVLCRMVIVRNGKRPMIKKSDSFELIPISDLGEIAEYTNMIIDYSSPNRVVFCIEAHENGPRVSDVEHYFRTIANEKLALAKSLKVETYFKSSLKDTISNLKNVLSFELKFTPSSIKAVNESIGSNFLMGLLATSSLIDPQSLTLKASFKKRIKATQVPSINKKGNSFIEKILTFCAEKSENLELIDNISVDYVDINGEVDNFSLLSDKIEIRHEVKSINEIKLRELHDSISDKIDEVLLNLK